MPIEPMGRFTAIGMRTKVEDPTALIINTCGQNDTDHAGTPGSWTWSNPTNRAIVHRYEDIGAVSVECLWQGTKIRQGMTRPNDEILQGDWRKGKGKRPIGAYAGPNAPLITTPGEARRRIYLPAFRNLIEHWLRTSEQVRRWVEIACEHPGNVYLRDFDTGRGLDRNGPMSHAWVLATFLNNNGIWPDEIDSRERLPDDIVEVLSQDYAR